MACACRGAERTRVVSVTEGGGRSTRGDSSTRSISQTNAAPFPLCPQNAAFRHARGPGAARTAQSKASQHPSTQTAAPCARPEQSCALPLRQMDACERFRLCVFRESPTHPCPQQAPALAQAKLCPVANRGQPTRRTECCVQRASTRTLPGTNQSRPEGSPSRNNGTHGGTNTACAPIAERTDQPSGSLGEGGGGRPLACVSAVCTSPGAAMTRKRPEGNVQHKSTAQGCRTVRPAKTSTLERLGRVTMASVVVAHPSQPSRRSAARLAGRRTEVAPF